MDTELDTIFARANGRQRTCRKYNNNPEIERYEHNIPVQSNSKTFTAGRLRLIIDEGFLKVEISGQRDIDCEAEILDTARKQALIDWFRDAGLDLRR
jgi:hypothetical protein